MAPPSFRAIHSVPALRHFSPEEGVPGFLSPEAFNIAWTQYMDLMTEKLNALTAGTDYENMKVEQIIKQTSRQAYEAPIFNHASMAFNNNLFFENLANTSANEGGSEATGEDRIPPRLREQFVKTFSSVETLRREFIATAVSMFGPGFVWLVRNAKTSELRILTTYLAGTPFTAAHWRRQGYDTNTRGADPEDPVSKEAFQRNKIAAGMNESASFSSGAPGGVDTIPLLCLNTWQHVWLPDYGLGVGGHGGKRVYVENWWECIDWEKVQNLATIGEKSFMK